MGDHIVDAVVGGVAHKLIVVLVAFEGTITTAVYFISTFDLVRQYEKTH